MHDGSLLLLKKVGGRNSAFLWYLVFVRSGGPWPKKQDVLQATSFHKPTKLW